MWAASCAVAIAAWPLRVHAQGLVPKRTLTTGPAPGCAIVPAGQAPIARRDNAEARRLATAGQEAALVGDQPAARDAFARAAALNPGDERVAYDLARAHEELADTTKSIAEYCRYLTLSPSGREAADVRDRLLRLVPRPTQQKARDVEVAFRLGLVLYDDARYEASARAFDDVVRDAPQAPEGWFNRGLARAADGQRSDALKDLEQYRAAAPTVNDRVEVGRAIETLRRPVYSPTKTFARSIIPGFGQFYTGRPVLGVGLLVAVAGSVGWALIEQETQTTVAYTDPNGVPAPYTQTTIDRPNFETGMAVAIGLTLLGSAEAVWYAKRSQEGASIVARRGAPATPTSGGLSMSPTIDLRGRAGLRFSAKF